jgi:putative N-acetyltransferase (TIGR04045 family)
LTCRLAVGEAERAAYFEVRRAIFCEEQGIFDGGDDRDACDELAHPIVCLTAERAVVGVVRIWTDGDGVWWGGRLGVRRDFRGVAGVGPLLIRTAVGTARAWGARQFLATVQRANVPLFRRMHWRTLEELELHGRAHHLMEAALERYVPIAATLQEAA